MDFKRTDQTMDNYLMEFDALQEKAGARMFMESGFPDEFASVLRMHKAAPSTSGKSQALVIIRNILAFPEAASQMRRLFGPRGGAARRDALVAADMDMASEAGNFAAWAANRRAKKGKQR